MLTELRLPGRLAHLAADLRDLFAAEPVGVIAFAACGVRADHLRAVRRLAVPPRPVRLTFCRVMHADDPLGVLVAALSAPFASAAVGIDASGCSGGPALAQVIATSPFLTAVKALNLDHNRLDAVAAAALLRARSLDDVEWLSVRGNVLGPPCVDKLTARFGERLLV